MKSLITIALSVLCASMLQVQGAVITGCVTADGKPMAGVRVSDGVNIVLTDAEGNYRLDSNKAESTVFVITPSGYIAESVDGFQPQFWALLDETSDVGERHDFKLSSENQNRYAIMFTTDAHLTNDSEKDDCRLYETQTMPRINELVKELSADNRAVYSFNLGDLSHDLFWYDYNMPLDSVVEYVKRVGYPTLMYSLAGNHDNDGGIVGENTDHRSEHLFHRTLGPTSYSMDIGRVHWIMLDNIIYKNEEGKGKKATGIKGDRSYSVGFTPNQMTWLVNDINLVPDSMQINICCHAPLLYPRKSGTQLADPGQLDRLSTMLSRFDKVNIFSGHAHRNLYRTDKRWPKFNQYVFVATSGAMWTTGKESPIFASDGTPAGVWTGRLDDGKNVDMSFHTYRSGDPQLRAYDMNTVADYYRKNKDVKYQRTLYPGRVNYGDGTYKNKVMVNFWGEHDGRKLHIYEDGKPLEIEKVTSEDPLYNVVFHVRDAVKTRRYSKSHDNIKSFNMYCVTTSSPKSEILIEVTDKDGKVIHSETMQRPKKFDMLMN